MSGYDYEAGKRRVWGDVARWLSGECPCTPSCGRAHRDGDPCHCPELEEERA